MTSLESRCLESFGDWLHSLGDDSRALALLLERPVPEPAQRAAAVALTYLFKSLDLIPDGLEDLGFIDDAFVLRVAATRVPAQERAAEETGILQRLSNDAELIREFLGSEYVLLEAYVQALENSAARGRSVADVLGDESVRADFIHQVRQFADSYAKPAFLRDAKNLVKIRAFLTTRLNGKLEQSAASAS